MMRDIPEIIQWMLQGYFIPDDWTQLTMTVDARKIGGRIEVKNLKVKWRDYQADTDNLMQTQSRGDAHHSD